MAATKRKRPSKAEQERRAAQAAKDTGEGQPALPEDAQPANGVFVTRTDDGNGNISVGVAPLGDVRIAELPTLFAVAKKQVEQQLGVGD